MININCIDEPPKELLVRERCSSTVKKLKVEMIENPCKEVTPILCLVKLAEGETFKASLRDSYRYISIGGNHSRQAIQELLKEKKELEKNKLYSHRLCAVYLPMDATLARRLASKHNRAATFTHEMTNWNWVSNKFAYIYTICNNDYLGLAKMLLNQYCTEFHYKLPIVFDPILPTVTHCRL